MDREVMNQVTSDREAICQIVRSGLGVATQSQLLICNSLPKALKGMTAASQMILCLFFIKEFQCDHAHFSIVFY